MNVKLTLYTNSKINITCSLIQHFWKEHNNYNQSFQEAVNDLNTWTGIGHFLYLIQYSEQDIGFIHLSSRGGQIDWIEDIFVLPEFQGKGIGTYAIKQIEHIVKKYSHTLYIEVAARNEKAIRLYHRIGYDCLNTITIKKDFHKEIQKPIRYEEIMNLDFKVKDLD